MSSGVAMTVRKERENNFCRAYHEFIQEYVRKGVTEKEAAKISRLHGVAAVCSSDVTRLVTSLRNTDEMGWPLHKCSFVERYLMSLAPPDASVITLCQVNNDVLSGIRFFCGIPIAPYRDLVMRYKLSSAEKKHPAALCAPVQMPFEERAALLATLIGIDTTGWHKTKNAFLEPYAEFSTQVDNETTIVLEVLHKVRAVFEQHIAIAPCAKIA